MNHIFFFTRLMINQTWEQSLFCGNKNSLNSSNVTAILMAVIFGIISLMLAVLLLVFIKKRKAATKRKKGIDVYLHFICLL